MEAKRIQEAEDCLKKAEKALKTSMISLKFKPDYDTAASETERAAVCFKNLKNLDRCRKSYLQAADYHDKNNVPFHAAKCKEQAAFVCRDMGDLEEAKRLMLEASTIYAETGTPETSALALEKAAKFFESEDPEKAIDMYLKGYELICCTDKMKQAGEFLRSITKLYLKMEKFKEAADNVAREIEMYNENSETVGKVGVLTTGYVLCQLARDDPVSARAGYQKSFSMPGFSKTEDAISMSTLLDAYETGNVSAFKNVLQRPHMKTMNNEYLRLMRTLEIPAHRIPKEPQPSAGAAGGGDAEPTAGGLALDDDELDEEGGLC